MQLCLASNNAHKKAEIEALLPAHISLLSLQQIGYHEELPETNNTLEGNSRQKALYVWEHYQLNCLSDDSGLEVEALLGEPGVDSAHYSGSRDALANMDLLLTRLSPFSNRRAQFRTVLTLVWEGQVHTFEGILEGTIGWEKQGTEGFGYDPIFIPQGQERTLAQFSLAEKNTVSHRARALEQLLSFISRHFT